MVANSIFIGDYLTTQGQSPIQDLEMIRDLGYQIDGKPGNFIDGVLCDLPRRLKLKPASHQGGSNDIQKHETLAVSKTDLGKL
jgi:hypothetical protein